MTENHSSEVTFVYLFGGRGSSVGTATRFGLDSPGIESRWGLDFPAPNQTGPEALPASYKMGTGSLARG